MADDKPLSEREREQIQRLFSSPIDIPPQHRSWLEQMFKLTMRGGTDSLPSNAETTDGAQAKIDAHVNDPLAAHAASAISFTPYGTLAADDVQEAIQELLDEAGGGGGSLLWEDV